MIIFSQLIESSINNQTKRSRVGLYLIDNFKVVVLTTESSFKYKYILPGGGIEGKETIQQAAARECKEEAGIVPKNIKVINTNNTPYLKCGLKEYGFKYDCSELYYAYGYIGEYDDSEIETYNGFKPQPLLLSYQEVKDWLIWAIKITKNEIPRNFKYKADLEILEWLKDNNLVK